MRELVIEVGATEWLHVSSFVASAVGDDEMIGAGHVRLRNTPLGRRWDATDGHRYSHYEGAPGGPEVTVTLPARLVRAAARLAAVADSPALQVAVDEGGVPVRVGLRSGRAEVGMPPGPSWFPDVDDIAERAMDAPYIEASVDRWLLRSAVCTAMEVPAGLAAVGPRPSSWLDVSAMALLFTVDWDTHGETVFLVDAVADGEAQVAVDIAQIERFVASLEHQWDEDTVHMSVPLDATQPLIMRSGAWRCYLLPVDADADGLRAEIDELLGDSDLDELAAGTDGSWSCRAGDVDLTITLVPGAPARIAVSTTLLEGVTASVELMTELNDINARVPFVGVVLHGDRVEVGAEVLAEGLGQDTLRAACATVAQVASDLGPVMSIAFGGSTAFRTSP